MATYSELFDLRSEQELLDRIAVAVAVAAETIRNEAAETDNHANRLIWAREAFLDPLNKAIAMIWAVLAANKDLSENTILGASDAAIQAKVDAAVNVFVIG